MDIFYGDQKEGKHYKKKLKSNIHKLECLNIQLRTCATKILDENVNNIRIHYVFF